MEQLKVNGSRGHVPSVTSSFVYNRLGSVLQDFYQHQVFWMFLECDAREDTVSMESEPHLDQTSLPTRRQHCPLWRGGKGQDNQLATGWSFAFFQERCSLESSTSLSAEARSALVIETSYCLAHASSPFLPPWCRIGVHCASSRVTEQSPACVQK